MDLKNLYTAEPIELMMGRGEANSEKSPPGLFFVRVSLV
jgi:hypothetical protein